MGSSDGPVNHPIHWNHQVAVPPPQMLCSDEKKLSSVSWIIHDATESSSSHLHQPVERVSVKSDMK